MEKFFCYVLGVLGSFISSIHLVRERKILLFFITIIIVAAKAAVELVLTVIRIIVWILGRFLA